MVNCEACGELFEIVKGRGMNNRVTCYGCTNCDKKVSYRNKHLKRKYGITQFQYKQLFEKQDGKCGICETQMNFMNGTPTKGEQRNGSDCCIDHCHSKGHVRGLLCFHCNTALGHVFDGVSHIDKMRNYLLIS